MSGEDPEVAAALLSFLLTREPDEVGDDGAMRYELDEAGEFLVYTADGRIVIGDDRVRLSFAPDSAVELCQAILSCHARMKLDGGQR